MLVTAGMPRLALASRLALTTRLSFSVTRFAFAVTRLAFTAFTPRLAAATRTVFRALTLALFARTFAIFGSFGVRNVLAGQSFDRGDRLGVERGDHRDRGAGPPGAAGTADAMDVVVGMM